MLPLQHAGFQTSPMLQPFLASFGVPLWYYLSGTLFVYYSKHINVLGRFFGLRGLGEGVMPWKHNFGTCVGVSP